MAAVTRESLAEKVFETFEMTKATSRELVGLIFDTVSGAISSGDDVRIHGFGSFRTSQRAARTARNPRTGESVQVAARRVVRFTPAGPLTASLKSKPSARKPARRK